MELTVIIPVYNEAATIEQVVKSVWNEHETIVVDDGSTDATGRILAKLEYHFTNEWVDVPSFTVVSLAKNTGKGNAIRHGLKYATGDVVVIQDADLEYDPKDYPRLIAPIIDGRADVVYGSRFIGGEERRVLLFWHYVGNRFLTMLSNMFTNMNLTDMETGFKMFRREALESLDLKEKGFGFEVEVTSKIEGMRVYEVGISYNGRDYAHGKKITWKDGLYALWCILKYR